MAGKQTHPYHIVDPSPMPFLSTMAISLLAVGALMFMHEVSYGGAVLSGGFFAVLLCMWHWWKDVVREANSGKFYTAAVQHGLRVGMALFILSEVMFFFAFFFSFFKSALLPVDILDGVWPVASGMWPPEGVETFDPFDLPLLNTLVLLLSGTTVTWAHHALLENNRKDFQTGLLLTVLLGILFSCTQAYEYHHAAFGFKDGVYASNFYMATGFHGFHVMVGTLFLAVCYFRGLKGHFTPENHLGFEFAAWYWHFVDVVWLFLFICVYWWGR